MSEKKPLRCPTCGGPVAERSANPAFPFCCARCRTIDLGEWLTESYRIPAGPDETERDGPSTGELGQGGDDLPN